jgi:hypothetical protein
MSFKSAISHSNSAGIVLEEYRIKIKIKY